MAGDDKFLVKTVADVSGGQNSRLQDSMVSDNQSIALYNVDLSTPGKRVKFPGYSLIGNDVGSDAFVGLGNYTRQGYDDSLIGVEGTNVREWTGSGNWSGTLDSIALTAGTDVSILPIKESGLAPDDVFIIQNGVDHAFRLHKDASDTWAKQDLGVTAGTGSDSPPLSTVMCWYANRVWILKNDLLYFSAPYSADYSSAFDTVADAYRIPVGAEMALVPGRSSGLTDESGLIIFGEKAVWTLYPSVTPVATDKPQALITDVGCVAKKSVTQVNDDYFFLSQDGVRSIKRTVQDKLQFGASYPMSYALKDEYESISWAYVDKACSVFYDNKYFIALPVDSSTYNNQVWVYYPATQGWSVVKGWNVASWSKFKVGGKEYLYFGDATDGKTYKALTGLSLVDAVIEYQEDTKAHDMGYPFQNKWGGVLVTRWNDGGGTVTILYNKNDAGWVQLGIVDTTGTSGVTFPTSFPATFGEEGIITGKFHLDKIGLWNKLELRFYNSSTDDIKMLDYSLLTTINEFNEER